jgi:hypothetical protein
MDTCALVAKYIHKRWETCHIMVQICEVHETSNTTMVVQLKALFAQYELLDKVIAYVENEGVNLNTFIIASTNILFCVPLQLS